LRGRLENENSKVLRRLDVLNAGRVKHQVLLRSDALSYVQKRNSDSMNHFYIWWVFVERNYAHRNDYTYNDQDKDANMTFSLLRIERENSSMLAYMALVR
jgi:hypothetical protein